MKTIISDGNKIIQGFWIKPPLTMMERLTIKSFLRKGHIFHLYVYDNIKGIPKGTVIKNANEILPQNRIFIDGQGSYSAFSNLFRYKLLYEKGGWWVDLDAVCLKPFNFKSEYVFSSQNMPGMTLINCGVMKVPKRCELIKDCYEKADSLGVPNVPFGSIGPGLFSQLVIKSDLKSFCRPPRAFCPIDPWKVMDFINPHINFKIPEDSYSIHLWQNLWRLGNVNKNILYPKTTLYGRLQREILNPSLDERYNRSCVDGRRRYL